MRAPEQPEEHRLLDSRMPDDSEHIRSTTLYSGSEHFSDIRVWNIEGSWSRWSIEQTCEFRRFASSPYVGSTLILHPAPHFQEEEGRNYGLSALATADLDLDPDMTSGGLYWQVVRCSDEDDFAGCWFIDENARLVNVLDPEDPDHGTAWTYKSNESNSEIDVWVRHVPKRQFRFQQSCGPDGRRLFVEGRDAEGQPTFQLYSEEASMKVAYKLRDAHTAVTEDAQVSSA